MALRERLDRQFRCLGTWVATETFAQLTSRLYRITRTVTAMSELRVLNAYAGIGGNRHLWPAEWHVTAVEINARIAAEYARRYPQDTVIVGDAHEFVMEHAHEFDAVWTSPPCPTHSRFNHSVKGMKNRAVKPPDPRLWEEIAYLRDLGVRYVVENVHVYYEPPIQPDVVTLRHYYWVSAAPLLMSHAHTGISIANKGLSLIHI